jgi:hypothetical protein
MTEPTTTVAPCTTISGLERPSPRKSESGQTKELYNRN